MFFSTCPSIRITSSHPLSFGLVCRRRLILSMREKLRTEFEPAKYHFRFLCKRFTDSFHESLMKELFLLISECRLLASIFSLPFFYFLSYFPAVSRKPNRLFQFNMYMFVMVPHPSILLLAT